VDKYQKSDQAVIIISFARVNVMAFVTAFGVSLALFSMIATVALVLQGFSTPILHQLPGYEVSWLGSLVGAFYFGILGMIIGFILSVVWNLTHILYMTLVVVRAAWWRLMAD